MRLYLLTVHDEGTSRPDDIKLFTGAASAMAEFDRRVRSERMLGRPEVDEEATPASQDKDGTVYGRAVFANEDGTWTTISMFDRETEK